MNTQKIRAAVIVATLTASISLGATEAATAVTVRQHSARPAAELRAETNNAATASTCSEALDTHVTSNPDPHQATPGPGASSRLSGLPLGGAAAYNPVVDGPPPLHQAAPSAPRTGALSRLSGLPLGGAAAYNPVVDGPPPMQAARTAPGPGASSRLSSLPFGGAADCV